MKILISSYWILGNTGYGNQTFYLAKELQKYGHQIYLIAWDVIMPYSSEPKTLKDLYGSTLDKILQAHPEKAKTVQQITYFLPPTKPNTQKQIKPNLNLILDPLIKEHQIERLILIHDIWPFLVNSKFSIPSYLWIPVHSDPPEKETFEMFKFFNWIISPSQFGYQTISRYHPRTGLIHHIVPVIQITKTKSELKKIFHPKLLNSFLVTMVARNSELNDRKAFKENIEGFKMFYQKYQPTYHHPNLKPFIYLYLHTDWEGSINISELTKDLPSEILIKPDLLNYRACLYSTKLIYKIYKASDVLLSASCAEGFGLPLVEAQLMGCPVLVNSTTAMPENTFFGQIVNSQTQTWSRPDANQIFLSLEKMYLEHLALEKGSEIQIEIQKLKKEFKIEMKIEMIKERFDSVRIGRKWNQLILLGDIQD